MQLPQKRPGRLVLGLILAAGAAGSLFWGSIAHAEPATPMHWSGDKTRWDRKKNRVELKGHAAVHQPGETITADEITLDLDARTLHAIGHCVYIADESVIHSDEMFFNLDTRTGTIIGGRVSNRQFTLTGERINKLGPRRFQTHRGEYTTCLDCPNSWSLRADDVDLEFEGYAYMSNVTGKIKDASVFWFPYLIVPLKTIRQSGFLFPKLGGTSTGPRAVLPFFWAINRSSDMTIGVGTYAGRGARVEWQGRYRLSERSYATADYFFLHDKLFLPRKNRWGLMASQFQELPLDVDQKLRLLDVSDNYFPRTFGDVPGQNEAFISSELIFSRAGDQVSSFLAFRRFRNLLNLESPVSFDGDTVQVYPQAVVTTNDRFIWDNPKIATGLTLGVTNFTRTSGGFDVNPLEPVSPVFRPGEDPLREATRVSATPSIYTTLRLADRVSIVPSAEYRAYFYSFHNVVENLVRGYGIIRTDISTQLEKVYETDDPEIPRVKHLIRPQLSYSLIPIVNESQGHPFIRQMDYARDRNFSGFNFDNYDIVPRDNSLNNTNYFIPLGHSLSYGFTTQMVRRRGRVEDLNPSYQRSVELRMGQTYNFRELRKARDEREPLSRYFAGLNLDFDRLGLGVDYFYQPYLTINENSRRHIFSGALTYTFEKTMKQEVWRYERSISLGYYYNKVDTKSDSLRTTLTWSLNDYVLPSVYVTHDFVSNVTPDAGGTLKLQPASRCWGLEMGPRFGLCSSTESAGQTTGFCLKSFVFNLTLNLTGDGLGSIGSLTGANHAK